MDPRPCRDHCANHVPQGDERPQRPHLRQHTAREVRGDGVRGPPRAADRGVPGRPRDERAQGPPDQLPLRGARSGRRRHPPQPGQWPRHGLHRRPRLSPVRVRAVLPRGGGDHERARGPPALGQAPLPDRDHSATALPAMGPVHRGPRPPRPGPRVRQRLSRARAPTQHLDSRHIDKGEEVMSEPVAASDQGINESFGYKQELRRALRLFSLYAVAFSIISITTGLFANYGFGLAHLGAAMIWLWPVAAVGQMLVALVVAELGTRIPLAGYSYQWGARLVNTTYGWFTGFVGLAYLAVGAAGINFVVVAPVIATILNLDASNPTINLVITFVIFAIVGFELAADLGEEAVAARVTVPRAVIWSVASSAILGMVALIGFTIAI